MNINVTQAQIIIKHNGKPGVVKLSAGQLEALSMYLPAICGGNITIKKEEPMKALQ